MIRLVVDNTRRLSGDVPKLEKTDAPSSIEDFRLYLFVTKALQPNTVANYVRVAAMAIREMGTDQPTQKQAETFIGTLRSSGKSHSHITNVMRVLEHYTVFIGSPMTFTRPRKPKRVPPEPLTEAEVAVFLAACKDVRELAILSLVASSGIRNEELCNLRVRDVDMAGRELRVIEGKGLKDRRVNFDGKVVPLLNEYLAAHPRTPDDHLFTTIRDGNQYTTTALRRLVKRVASRTRIKKRIYPHLLRHSLASNLIARGANVRMVQHQLGHSFLETTMIYVQTNPEMVKRVFDACSPAYL